MKKILSLILALVATTTLWAYDFQSGDLYYNITSRSAPYTVEVDDATSSITIATIPSTVTYNGTTYSVTSIGDYAFDFCRSLTSITIPSSVTSIGDYAFMGCSSLTSVTIPNSVTSIGYSAFRGCSALTSITIPNSVTSIGDGTFYGCSSLPVENNLRYADTYLVEAVDETLSTYSIKEGTKWIGAYAFSYCRSLTSITIPNSVTSIGYYAFCKCSSLRSITLSESVMSIGCSAFYGCSSLISITIPNSVTSIGHSAFSRCESLTTVTIGNSVTSIGEKAFSYCSSLKSITIPNSVTSIGPNTFFSCSNLTSIKRPNSITSMREQAQVNATSKFEQMMQLAEKDQYVGYTIYENPTGYSRKCLIQVYSLDGSDNYDRIMLTFSRQPANEKDLETQKLPSNLFGSVKITLKLDTLKKVINYEDDGAGIWIFSEKYYVVGPAKKMFYGFNDKTTYEEVPNSDDLNFEMIKDNETVLIRENFYNDLKETFGELIECITY